ncbi:MAG: lipoprotein, partial [Bacilli bacterium]|nr:lipoprotein [Bacilli bacterium]
MKKKILIAISFLAMLASCQVSGTTGKYDGKAILRELESKK